MPEVVAFATRPPQMVGYARVSTVDQDPEHQVKALRKAGCEAIYTDYVSGSRSRRPELDQALRRLQSGDTLVVWKLDRLGRSLAHLVELSADLSKRGVHLRSLTQGIDTHTPTGRMMFGLLGAMAEFERNLISERTKLAARRRFEKGRRWGRSSQFHNPKRVEFAKSLLRDPTLTRKEVAAQLRITTNDLYRWFPGGDPDRFEGYSQRNTPLHKFISPNLEAVRGDTARFHGAQQAAATVAASRQKAIEQAEKEARQRRQAALDAARCKSRELNAEKKRREERSKALQRERKEKKQQALVLLRDPRLSYSEIAKRVGVTNKTLYRWSPGGRFWDNYIGRHIGRKYRKHR